MMATVLPPTVAVSFATSPITYDANPHAATVAVTGVNSTTLTDPADGTIAVTYLKSGSSSGVPTNAGSYTASATFTATNPNYNTASSASPAVLTIDKADPVVTATGATCTYDGSPCAGSGTATGVNGESLTPVTAAYTVMAAPPRAPGDLLTTAPSNARVGDGRRPVDQVAPASKVVNQRSCSVESSATPTQWRSSFGSTRTEFGARCRTMPGTSTSTWSPRGSA
jgi:hypothetical protein